MAITKTQVIQQMIYDSVVCYLEDADHLSSVFEEDKLKDIILNMFYIIGIKPSVKDVNKVEKKIKAKFSDDFRKQVNGLKERIKDSEVAMENEQDRIKGYEREIKSLIKNKKKPRKKK